MPFLLLFDLSAINMLHDIYLAFAVVNVL